MAPETITKETTLRIRRRFAASPEALFRAWTEPEQIKRWLAPTDEFSTPVAQVDLRVGGGYRIQMKSPEGKLHTAVGSYRTVDFPAKLVLTWDWQEQSIGETVVTVEFREQGNETELILTHELFPDQKSRDLHNQGWNGCLDRLARAL